MFLAEASSAPLRMVSQKVSPGAAWVTMAIFIGSVWATWPPAPSAAAGVRPPCDEQPARARAGTSSAAPASRHRDAHRRDGAETRRAVMKMLLSRQGPRASMRTYK
ncbi:hypothetical protein GCM10009696_16540 [Kocuria himachalensis]